MSEHRHSARLHLAKIKQLTQEDRKVGRILKISRSERHESTLKRVIRKYDTAIELLFKYDGDRAVRISADQQLSS